MTQLFERNVAAIREHDPELADALQNLKPSPRIKRETGKGRRVEISVKTDNGENSIRLPDLAQPALDNRANELSGARMTVVLGFGSGRLFSEAVSRTGEQGFVLLVEPDIDLFAAVIREEDFSKIFKLARVSLAVGEPPRSATIGRTEKEFDVFTLSDFTILENPWSAGLYRAYFEEVKERLSHLKKIGDQNLVTLSMLGDEWRENIVTNLPAVLSSAPVSSIFGKFAGVPSAIVSAGPSLNKNIWMLSAFKSKGVIIAVDTAVRPLLSAGIIPDIVMSLDSQIENYFHLAGLSLPETLFALNPVTHPKIVEEHTGPAVFTNYSHPLFQWLETVIGERGTVRTGGSVATSALDLALKMECSPVILIGQDLCYTTSGSHSRGTIQEMTSHTIPANLPGAFAAKNIFGADVVTLPKMDAWRKWFELVIAGSETPVINATEGGLGIDGTENKSLLETISTLKPLGRDIRGEISKAAQSGVDASGIEKAAQAFTSARDDARFIKTICGKGLSALKSGIGHLKPDGSPDKAGGISFGEMKEFSRQILTKNDFVEINRWSMDKTLDKMETLQRKGMDMEEKDRNTLNMESYRILFSETYETAVKFEKAASRALSLLAQMSAGSGKKAMGA